MKYLIILSMVGINGNYLGERSKASRISFLKTEQPKTAYPLFSTFSSYLSENTHSVSMESKEKEKKRNNFKYVALETGGGLIGGSITALGTYLYIKDKRDYNNTFTLGDPTILILMLSHIPGSILGIHTTGKVLKRKGSFLGLIVGTLLGTIFTPPIADIIIGDRMSTEIGKKATYGIFITGISIGGVIGYNYKTLL